jgi:hypothetical protein
MNPIAAPVESFHTTAPGIGEALIPGWYGYVPGGAVGIVTDFIALTGNVRVPTEVLVQLPPLIVETRPTCVKLGASGTA